jgi:hypothetical protein
MSLLELSQQLGCEPEAGSHDKGDLRPNGERWGRTILWRNAQRTNAPLGIRCLEFLSQIPQKCLEFASTREGVSVSLDIAVFNCDICFNVLLPVELIRKLAAFGIEIETTVYAVDDREESVPRKE